MDANFDISEHVVSIPVVEIDENVINPSGTWGDDSLKLQFGQVSEDIKDITGAQISTNTKDSEHDKIREETSKL